MPRTKRVSKKRNYSNSSISSQTSNPKSSMKGNKNRVIITDINHQFQSQLAKLDKILEQNIKSLKGTYELAKFSIPKSMLDAPYKDSVDKSSKYSEVTSSTVDHASPDQSQFGHTAKADNSKDSGNGEEPTTSYTVLQNRFRTPAYNIGAGGKYNVITPKVQPNSVLSVLRRPREGEMALSMSGSPLLVSSIIHESIANVNVPLPNGAVMSILPQAGLRPHDLPNMDSETVKQLKLLKDNLASLLNEKF